MRRFDGGHIATTCRKCLSENRNGAQLKSYNEVTYHTYDMMKNQVKDLEFEENKPNNQTSTYWQGSSKIPKYEDESVV